MTRILVTYGVKRNGWYRGPGSRSGPPLARERRVLGMFSGNHTPGLKVMAHPAKTEKREQKGEIYSCLVTYLIRQNTDFSCVKSLAPEPGNR